MSGDSPTPSGRVRFSGLILAGGVGRRYGGPKAFARLPDGRTFLEACRDLLAAAGARPVAATLPPGEVADGIGGIRPLPLPEVGLDMLTSIRWGVRHLLSDRGWTAVVVLPVDHPLVDPGAVVSLARTAAAAAIPSAGGKHGHPVLIARGIAEELALGKGEAATLRDVLDRAGAVDVPVEDHGIHANCNTPEVMREWVERLGR